MSAHLILSLYCRRGLPELVIRPVLLLRRLWRWIRGLSWRAECATDRGSRIILHPGRLVPESIAEAAARSALLPVNLTIQVRRVLHPHLQLRLVRRGDQKAAIEGWVVDELPLVVLLLFVVLADGFLFAEAGHSHDGRAPELSVG